MRDQFELKEKKKLFQAVVILLVSKLQAGREVRDQFKLKEKKKLSQGLVALSPKYHDKLGIVTIFISVAVVHIFGIRGSVAPKNFHLVAQPARLRVTVYQDVVV